MKKAKMKLRELKELKQIEKIDNRDGTSIYLLRILYRFWMYANLITAYM